MPQLIEIRPFRPEDDADLHRIRRAAVLGVSPRFYDANALGAWAEDDRLGKNHSIVASGGFVQVATFPDESLVGFAGYSLNGTSAMLIRLYVDPSAQGCGVGTGLLERVEADLRLHGAALVNLEASLSALAFYENRGYAVTARVRQHYEDGTPFEACMMEKAL
jgi:putative acetyltransferase